VNGSPLLWQTSGLPPSPLHVSFPAIPPAQMKESSRRNLRPSLVRLRESWHCWWPTTGRSISFSTTWYSPAAPNWSFPQPVAKQFCPSNCSSGSGRQTVSMCSCSSNGSVVYRSAQSLARFLSLKSGCMSRVWTARSWCALGSVWFCVSHSPHRTFSFPGSLRNFSAQWAAVRMTPGAMRDPPHW